MNYITTSKIDVIIPFFSFIFCMSSLSFLIQAYKRLLYNRYILCGSLDVFQKILIIHSNHPVSDILTLRFQLVLNYKIVTSTLLVLFFMLWKMFPSFLHYESEFKFFYTCLTYRRCLNCFKDRLSFFLKESTSVSMIF